MSADNLLSNIGSSSPPLQTPVTDKDGHLTPAWFAWFNQVGRRTGVTLPNAAANSGLPQGLVSPVTIQDTHANRTNYAARAYLGAFYYETDRTVFYVSALVANVPTWIYSAGQMIAALASRPAGLGTNDTGFLFLASDTTDLYEWSGSAWGYYGGAKAAQDFDPVTDGGASLGSTALRFLNLFLKNAINVGGASAPRYPAEVLGPASAQVHVSDHDADDGGWIMSLHGNGLYLMQGVEYNGTNFVAKETTAVMLALRQGIGISYYYDSGLTVGNTYTPTQRLQIDSTGSITIVNAITASGNINTTAGGYQVAGTQVVESRRTGWTAPTGTLSRATFLTTSVTLPVLAETVGALIDDLISHGLIGT